MIQKHFVSDLPFNPAGLTDYIGKVIYIVYIFLSCTLWMKYLLGIYREECLHFKAS